jgi:hypothetical protein
MASEADALESLAGGFEYPLRQRRTKCVTHAALLRAN